ncbi:hypothetical protein GUJ93_ZPchr0010g11162 [Zizania palustris]|uniref:Uncharacterized protein n=1 Tax=Zizania palustris TaxID=103762 RepID=A0A8J5WBA4_ZIZPA|nr:hypothetical protein GUJ93_ZPchr0010g11162 [Zizania palustris]
MVMKMVSMIEDREIIMRDCSRFSGVCSCGDFCVGLLALPLFEDILCWVIQATISCPEFTLESWHRQAGKIICEVVNRKKLIIAHATGTVCSAADIPDPMETREVVNASTDDIDDNVEERQA